jgi:hypothetical protein
MPVAVSHPPFRNGAVARSEFIMYKEMPFYGPVV